MKTEGSLRCAITLRNFPINGIKTHQLGGGGSSQEKEISVKGHSALECLYSRHYCFARQT